MQRTALITGGNRGLGLETARQLAARDWHVILGSRDPDKARGLVPGADVRALDLGDSASIAALASALAGEGVTLDALVNNAAISMRGFDARVVERTLAINLLGTLQVTAALAPRVADGGTIVMVSSAMGDLSALRPPVRGRAEHAASLAEVEALAAEFVAGVGAGVHEAAGWPSNGYGVSKVLLNAATRVLARELADRRIRVNAVCPGWVRTNLGGPHAPREVGEGAASIVAAVFERATGGFFRDGQRIRW